MKIYNSLFMYVIFQISKWKLDTLPETNIAPKNGGFQ